VRYHRNRERQLALQKSRLNVTPPVGVNIARRSGVKLQSRLTLSYRGVDSTLTNYNQTAIDLENITGWWTALRPDKQADPSNVDALVQHTEEVLATEASGWSQRMQDVLANLRKDRAKEADDEGTEGAGRREGGPSLVVAARGDATPTVLSSQLPGAS
jgi:hypothetical protein